MNKTLRLFREEIFVDINKQEDIFCLTNRVVDQRKSGGNLNST